MSQTPRFPDLPIISIDPPRKTQREKYGSFFYVGIAGLVVLGLLIAWFSWSVWSLRAIWANVYRIHDATLPDPERIAAAKLLSDDTRYADAQAIELCIDRRLPDKARYVLSERLRESLVSNDPPGYVQLLVDSKTEPSWLRVLLARPLAYAAIEGIPLPKKGLVLLESDQDPNIVAWVLSAEVLSDQDPSARVRLEAKAKETGPGSTMAKELLGVLDSAPSQRRRKLDHLTLRIRQILPEAADVWNSSSSKEATKADHSIDAK